MVLQKYVQTFIYKKNIMYKRPNRQGPIFYLSTSYTWMS
jgi:hypothetical protein